MLNSAQKNTVALGSLIAAIGVIFGAFGAHGLEGRVPANLLETYQTGVTYQFYHAFALVALGFLGSFVKNSRSLLTVATWLFGLGILFFSGSLYLLATQSLTGIHWWILGPITPIGGIFFIAGWGCTAWGAWKG